MKALVPALAFALAACFIPVQQQPAPQPAGGYSGAPPAGGGYAGNDGSDGSGGGYSNDGSSGGGYGANGTAGSAGNAGSAPAAPTVVSVTIRSACANTVKVFYGEKPKFGSGTYSSISSNSVQSHSFRPGEMFWVVDDSETGLGSATISAGTRELEITSSCSGVSAR